MSETTQQVQDAGGQPSGYDAGDSGTAPEPLFDTEESIHDRGFASMDPEKQREIARKGGRSRGEQMKRARRKRELQSD